MKLSAKITTVTFLAATALGAASIMGGCTVTSTSSTDTDGGTSSSGGSSSGGSSGSTTTDGGSSGDGGGGVCDIPKQTTKYEAACQTCSENKCCGKMQDCFGQDADGGVDCNAYAECAATCESSSDPDCLQKQCKDVTAQSIITAYEIMAKCQLDNCKTECFE